MWRSENLAAVLAVLPALKNPTISTLSDEAWLAVNTILDESDGAHHPAALERSGRAGHRRISFEQDRDVMLRISGLQRRAEF